MVIDKKEITWKLRTRLARWAANKLKDKDNLTSIFIFLNDVDDDDDNHYDDTNDNDSDKGNDKLRYV